MAFHFSPTAVRTQHLGEDTAERTRQLISGLRSRPFRPVSCTIGPHLQQLPKTVAFMDGLPGPGSPRAWRAPNFDIDRTLQTAPGPLLEVGGPSPNYPFVGPSALKNLVVSNVTPGLPALRKSQGNGRVLQLRGRVNLVVDAVELASRPDSLGAHFARSLPRVVQESALRAAAEAVAPGGLIVWTSVRHDTLKLAQKLGVEIVQFERTDRDAIQWRDMRWAVAWRKPFAR